MLTMSSMEHKELKETKKQETGEAEYQNFKYQNMEGRIGMNEDAYKTMGRTGAANIAVGVIILVTGIVTGILSIVAGAVLLKNKSKILF